MVYLLVFILTIFAGSNVAYSGTAADKECIEWMLSQYPELKTVATYMPEHDLLIEKIVTPSGSVSLIHTHLGSVASVPHVPVMDCRPKRSTFNGEEVKGISGFLNLALKTKVSGLFVEGGSRMTGIRFLQNMPSACKQTSYPNLTTNIGAVCNALSDVPLASRLLNSTTSVCKVRSQ